MKKIRIGLFGGWRGDQLMGIMDSCGAELVALCDKREDIRQAVGEKYPGIQTFSDFDSFIQYDMDGVILANYFHRHAEYAIRCLGAGKAVYSETMPSVTMAESVALCRAVERTGGFYMLGENYMYFKGTMALEELYKSGRLGRFVYGEGEYFHPNSTIQCNHLAPGEYHWRNWLPATYYLSHSLAPVLKITDARPKRVTAMASFTPDMFAGTARRNADALAMILIQTDQDAMIKVCGCAGLNPHDDWYRIAGTQGSAELVRGTRDRVRVNHLPDQLPTPDTLPETVYQAQWPCDGELADQATHSGGDFWVLREFVECLRDGKQPFLDVYRATDISSVAILGWRSILNGNCGYDIPDFRREEDRLLYENDHASPFPDESGFATTPCCSHPDYQPGEADLKHAREVDWPIFSYLVDSPEKSR